MSTAIGTHDLSCIGDDDYAAYAMSMQCNAEAANAALVASQDSFNSYLDRPWIEVVNANAIVIDDASGGGTTGPFGLIGETVRPGQSGMIVTANGLPAAYSIADSTTRWPSGIYLVGANINWTLTSATASSVRRLMAYGIADINGNTSSETSFYDLWEAADYQGDGGNSGALSICGLVQSAGELALVEAFFTHANTASDLTVAAGQWRLWATYLGSGLVI